MNRLSKKAGIRIAAGILVVVFLILILAGAKTKEAADSSETASGRAYIAAESAKDPSEVQNRIQSLKSSSGSVWNEDFSFDDLMQQIETLQLRELTEEEIYSLRSFLDTTVFVGDSMTQAILEYDLLDENHVRFLRSASISQLDEQVQEALSMLPDRIVFFMGLNDINYFEDTNDYYNAFYEKIHTIRSARPDMKIYVCSMLPPSDDLAAEREDLARSPEYDSKIEQLCMDTGCNYVDCKWMVRQEYYLEDGIHFSYGFYCVWLQYIAAVIQGG